MNLKVVLINSATNLGTRKHVRLWRFTFRNEKVLNNNFLINVFNKLFSAVEFSKFNNYKNFIKKENIIYIYNWTFFDNVLF
jgi:hypothetical protein